eukprot:c3833_g1_i1.p1 GENE.c3833_g1_i1~~c3833_g1_i1.p1  ORF type:complete len:483 (-),score=110.88 c3833_g1_i1:93-1505(-)
MTNTKPNVDSFDVEVEKTPNRKPEKSALQWTIDIIRYLYSGALLAFSIAVVMTGDQTDRELKGAGAIIVLWVLVIWLAVMEGGQNALVGLQQLDKSLYRDSHKISLISTKIAHQPGNMERFIVGRQLLVVVVVFTINLAGSIKEGCSTAFDVADWVGEIFCTSGLAMVFITIILGQLTSQIIASDCMLDFINNYLMVFTTYVALAIEFSGILHSVYLIQMIFMKLTGGKLEKTEEETPYTAAFFWGRVVFSLFCLSFCFAVVMHEIVEGRTNMWAGCPGGVSVLIFFILMAFVGMMEGMQIALFAVLKMDQTKIKASHPMAHANCELTFRGNNLPAFLVGRQICVTICMFVVARITGIDTKHHYFESGHTTFDFSSSMQDFINTGLLSALITTIIGSLSFRVIASAAPLLFLSNPLINLIIRLCLGLEATGVMNFSWLTAIITKWCMRAKPDDFYTKAPEFVQKERSTVP